VLKLLLSYIDKRPVVIGYNESLLKVLREILGRNRNHAILVDDNAKIWGILSIRDAAKAIFIEGEEGVELIELGTLGKVLESPAKIYASTPPLSISTDFSLKEAVELMIEKNIGFLPVLGNGGELLGALEEKSLAKAILGLESVSVCEKTTWDLVTIESDEEILAAVGIMLTYGIRHIVVKEDDSIYGLASLLKALYHITSEKSIRDLLRGSRAPIEEKVKIIAENPWILDCSYQMNEAASFIAADRMGAVLIKDQKDRYGILTDRDLLKILYEELSKEKGEI
jgi:CBS domain-containing protein